MYLHPSFKPTLPIYALFFLFFLTVSCEEDTDLLYDAVNEDKIQSTALVAGSPVAKFTSTATTGKAPFTVTFNGKISTDNEKIVKYQWHFGDTRGSTWHSPKHVYEKPGIYQTKLIVTDNDGNKNSKTVAVTVTGSSSSSSTSGTNQNYPVGAVKASTFGYKAGDATAAFKAAINSSKSFIIIDKQSAPWNIEPSRFYNIKNKTIIFEPGVVLQAKSGAFKGQYDVLLNFYNADNLTIEGYGATFSMNKNEYTTGEWRHTLKIDKCRNVSIKGLIFQNSGGDGIHISGGTSGGYSENITVEDVLCRNNRRQGMTILSAQNLWVRNSEFANSSGTKPESGVDLEPDYASDRLVNINFNNCKFTGNDNAGFKITSQHMTAGSLPLSVKVVDCEFINNGHAPNNSLPNCEISIGAANYNNPVKGQVLFERNTFTNSKGRILFSRKTENAFHVTFKDCTAKNVIQNTSDATIKFEPESGANNIGGFTFTNFYIEYSKDQPFMQFNGPRSLKVMNVKGNFTIKEPYDNPLTYKNGVSPSNASNLSVSYKHIK